MKPKLYNTVDWRNYLMEDKGPRVKKFLDLRGYDVFSQLSSNVNKANSKGHEKLMMLVHPNAGNVILIDKSEFDTFYDVAMNWFEKNEYYEMCQKIKEYKLNLNNKKRDVKIMNKTLI